MEEKHYQLPDISLVFYITLEQQTSTLLRCFPGKCNILLFLLILYINSIKTSTKRNYELSKLLQNAFIAANNVSSFDSFSRLLLYRKRLFPHAILSIHITVLNWLSSATVCFNNYYYLLYLTWNITIYTFYIYLSIINIHL